MVAKDIQLSSDGVTAGWTSPDDFVRANACLVAGAYGPATYHYRRAIGRHGPRDIYYQNLVLALRLLGDLDTCHREVRNGLAHNPTSRALRDLLIELNDEHLAQHRGPALSIVVPVYNSGRYLESCLRSILNQTFRDFELIVINDGSQDESGEIIERLAAGDDRVRVIWHETPSGNPGTPRNRALDIARGAYIGFVDSDDWIDPDYYEALMGKAREERADIVFSGGFVNHTETEASIRAYKNRGFEDPDSPRYKYHDSFMIWDKVFNARLVQGFDIRLAETKAAVDVPFVFRAYYWAFAIAYCDRTVAYHYRRESESSVTVNYRKSSDCQFEIEAYELIWDWAERHNVPEYFRDVIRYKQVNSYTYTLSVIAPDYFDAFFAKCRATFRKIDRAVVLKFSDCLKKNHIVKKYDAVLGKSHRGYARLFREDMAFLPVQSVRPANWDSECIFRIDGPRKGVLFFPDWSRSNPYQKLLYGALASRYNIKVKGFRSSSFTREVLAANRAEFSCIHLHWLHALMDFSADDGADAFFDTLAYARELGYKILYTAHNIVSHDTDHEERERAFRHRAAQQFDYLLAHGHYAKERLVEEVKVEPAKVHVVPHGSYEGFYPNYVSRHTARQYFSLADEDFVFLFFGNIKGYKGVDVLLEAFDGLRREQANARLLIAGRVFEPGTAELIQQYVDEHPGIIFHPGFIADEDAQYYFNAADMMVLPYRRILTSGAALLSLSYRVPVLAPRTGLLPELIEEGKQGYLFDDYEAMAGLMRSVLHRGQWAGGDSRAQYEFDDVARALRWTEIVRREPFNELFGHDEPREPSQQAPRDHDYALVRVIGNEQVQDDAFEATRQAIEFTLNNEPAFEGCAKLWVLNRLVDADRKQRLVELLEARGAEWVDWALDEQTLAERLMDTPLAFDELPRGDFKFTPEYQALDEAGRAAVDLALYKEKLPVLLGGAEAKNRALELGAERARWVLPLEGTCFVPKAAWQAMTQSVRRRDDFLYHVVSVEAVADPARLLEANHQPAPAAEPRILFRHDASLRFESEGSEHSAEHDLLVRLGVSGYWDKAVPVYPWKKRYVQGAVGTFCYAWSGWVGRCDASAGALIEESATAGKWRRVALVRQYDKMAAYRDFDAGALTFYAGTAPSPDSLSALKQQADAALTRPLVSVVDKQSLPPSLNRHDYWCPAPYAWPDPDTASGLPYVFQCEQRVPGTEVCGPSLPLYDRAPLQRLFDEVTILALSGHWTECEAHTEKAYRWVRAWFLDPATAMNPHLHYAKVARGHYDGRGAPHGVSDAKDFYYFLDAVRLIKRSAFWTKEDEETMNGWCREYLDWLLSTEQGRELVGSDRHHAIAFDLQVYALAAFLGDTRTLYETVMRAASRMAREGDSFGGELGRVRLRLWALMRTLVRRTSRFDLLAPGQWDFGPGVDGPAPIREALSRFGARAEALWSEGRSDSEAAIPPLVSLSLVETQIEEVL